MTITVRDNILMRNLSTDDASEIYSVIDSNRCYLRKWLPWVDDTDSTKTVENVINTWEKQREQGSDKVFGIYMDGKYIGNIGLHDIEINNKTAIIGYWLAESYQGSGVMSDCVKALTKYAFSELDLNTICIHCALDNNKSRAIPERLGFKESGITKDGEVLYGIPHDMMIYKLEQLNLVFPNPEHKQAAAEYLQEHIDNGEGHIHGSGGIQRDSFDDWLIRITNAQTAAQTGWVNCSTYFAFVGDRIVGTIQIRHTLNDQLLKSGGHIGYGVRPSVRRKGYATQMLGLALLKCRELGIGKALVTCDKDNIGSASTIQKNGGVLENEFTNDDGIVEQRYWIEL